MVPEDTLNRLRQLLARYPKRPFALVPTPCHRLNWLSEKWGAEVYCKREDLSGFGFGGNKSRKLERLVAEAAEHGCDALVTSGGMQSNFCRMAAAIGAANGMSVHLVLGGGRPGVISGNLLLDQLLGAETRHLESDDWNVWEEESEKLALELAEKGRKAFKIPIGGSVPMGVIGYVSAFLEILEEETRQGAPFDEIIHASGSGGTQAGLAAGKALTGWRGRITGVSVAMDREELKDKVLRLAREGAALLASGCRVDDRWAVVEDGFIGPGYAARTPEAETAIQVFARREGIFLDRVYTGKAAAALLDRLEKGAFAGKRVLFIHTGGQPEIFA